MIADICRHRFIRHGAAFLALWCASSLHAAEEDPIELLHADRVSLERADPGNAYYAYGDVHFRQGRSELFADEAIWFEDSDEIHLFGHVKVLDTLETLYCDTLIFISKTDIAFARGNVEYHRPASDLVARSKRGEYDRTNGTAIFYQDAVMYYQASDSSKQIVTTADTLRFEADSESGEAIGHVKVERPDGEITAKHARFTTGGIREQIEFVGEPEGTFSRNDIAGDTVVLSLLNDELETLDSKGNARATFRESSGRFGRTTDSKITSDNMVMYFDEGDLREVEAIGQAKSSYVPATGHPDERNDTSGDTVRITIVDSAVQRVQVIGGAAGTYYSPKGDTLVSVIDTIQYQSSYIDYRVDQAWIRLWDHADLTYGEVNLTAGQVLYQTEAAVLRAYALDDTLMPPPADYRGPGQLDSLPTADSLGPADTATTPPQQDERTIQQLPVLRERTQVVYGDQLVYDIQTQRGRIVQSSTQAQDGFYRGDDFRLEAAKTFYVENGTYTTCELDTPHFGFTGGKMKVREKDKVFARPVVLRIEQIPVLWIPYYVFSIKDDRHSGMLPLRFGNFERGSRYLRNIGYYFAVSDHFDFAPAMDIVEGEGVLWHLRTAYAWRYKLSGAFFGSYNKHTQVTSVGEQTTSRWNVLFSHNQQISPSVTLSGSGNFISDNSFYQDFTADPNFRLNRRLRSQVNLNKRWTSSSLILALDDSRNLDDDSRSSVLPRYALSIPQRQLFAPRKLKGGKTSDPRWFHNIRGGFNSVGQHLVNGSKTTAERTPGDTVNVKFSSARITVDNTANLNYSGKAGPLNVTPSLRFQESWYYIFTPTRDTVENGAGSIDDTLPPGVNSEEFYRRFSGSFSIGTQTNLYGIFNLNRGNIAGFRHVFTPSVTFSFAPAITQNQSVRNFTGVGGGGTRSAVMGLSMSNLFQMKTQSGEQERRWDLLNIGIGTSYNFESKTRKWSNITTSIRSGLVRNPDISISLVLDPYDLQTGELDYSPRLASISTAVSFRLTGRGQLASGPGYNVGGFYESQGGADIEGQGGSLGGFGQTNTKVRSWDFSAQYQFSEVRTPDPVNPGNTLKSITHWIRPNFRFNPTPNWDVQTNLYYDIRNQTMNDWTIRLQRDLHCWEAEFSWVVTGARAGYYFKINVKRISSLKFEKSESGLRDALFGSLPGT